MKTLINTLMIAGFTIALSSPVNVLASTNGPGETEKGTVIRNDKVSADLNTPATDRMDEVYDRKVMLGENGKYDVVITDAKGNVRMTGSFSNEELTRPEGNFTYYYPNGNVESKGIYANGVKSGTWERYNADGTAKAERNYTGMTWEDMAVTLGIASKAGSN